MIRLRTPLTLASVFVAVGLVVACQHDEESSYPTGLPVIDLDAGPIYPDAAEYTETLSLQQGTDDVSDYVRASGYVLASIEDTWTAFQQPNVVADRHNISSFTSAENVETGYEVSFAIYVTVNNIVTVNFTLTWREGAVEGTEAAPQAVAIGYQKTDGSSYISLMTGSIGLVQVTPTITRVDFYQRMNASNTDSSNIALWTNGMYASVVAYVHGKPLP
jgi:hypothetical protein